MSHGVVAEPAHRLRAVIVGSGMIGNVHRRAAILAGAEIVGVVEHDLQAAQDAAERWEVRNYYDCLADALEPDVDVVHICTPNITHAELTRLTLLADTHVICEKPLCLDPAEGTELAQLAESRGLVAAIPYIYRYHPLVREIRERRLAGEFGRLHLIHGSYLQDWLLSPKVSSWRVDSDRGGRSRAFADIGSHWCDLVEWVAGQQISALLADTAIAVPERPAQSGPTFSGASATATQQIAVQTEDIA
ncbi:MAG: Gfo/Idh/MocA family oxidoreductase, partial [Propionibacteriaceae bacterium]|nr:Gfo/Idh/MocA family oxidoreductase [Propionibacteriaceae bacterium]